MVIYRESDLWAHLIGAVLTVDMLTVWIICAEMCERERSEERGEDKRFPWSPASTCSSWKFFHYYYFHEK
jgi:hypothetical protein